MKTLYTLLAALLMAAGSMSVVAQMGDSGMGGESNQQSLFDSLDKDGDGALNRDEAGAAGLSGPSFSEADGDGDGVISKGEYDKLRTPGMR